MKLRDDKTLQDFKIHVKNDEFPCAKFIMAAHSPMLRAMLASDMAEVAKQEIRLDHICKEIVQIILDYMYCENVSFHKDQLMDLIAAADYLQMAELKEWCLDEVPDVLEPGNVISWWKEAAKMNYDTIKVPCEEILAANFRQISHQNDFLNLYLDEMQQYVSGICTDSVNSDHIVDGLMRWVNHEDERVPHLEDLLNKSQLNKCSVEGLTNAMETYETLLDKTQTGYKLLSKTLADIATDISKTTTDTMVILGGEEDDGNTSLLCWKVEKSNEVVHLCNIPTSQDSGEFSVCMFSQGLVITGGIDSRMCMMFIASTKSWVRLQNMLQNRDGHGSVCIKGVLYVLGGFVGDCRLPSNSVQSMVMEDGEWKFGPDIPLVVTLPKVATIAETLYMLDVEESRKLLHLNVDEHVWKELAPMPVEECYGVGMTSAQGLLFVAGGERMICASYNPATNTWCTGQKPFHSHQYGALTYHKEKLLLLGGHYNGLGTDEVEEYDIDEDKWSLCSYKMPRKLGSHHAFVLNIQPCE